MPGQSKKHRFRKERGLAVKHKTLHPRGLQLKNIAVSLIDELAKLSEWGGNKFERAADGAAHMNGHRFDAAQYYRALPMYGSYTLIDRVVARPLQAVYLDGWQHRARPDTAAKDHLQDIQLGYDGFRVVRITDTEFNADPIGTIQRRIDWIGSGSGVELSQPARQGGFLPNPVITPPVDIKEPLETHGIGSMDYYPDNTDSGDQGVTGSGQGGDR